MFCYKTKYENKSNKDKNKNDKRQIYTGLEHRQTLRACDFHFNLQIEIENENIDK